MSESCTYIVANRVASSVPAVPAFFLEHPNLNFFFRLHPRITTDEFLAIGKFYRVSRHYYGTDLRLDLFRGKQPCGDDLKRLRRHSPNPQSGTAWLSYFRQPGPITLVTKVKR